MARSKGAPKSLRELWPIFDADASESEGFKVGELIRTYFKGTDQWAKGKVVGILRGGMLKVDRSDSRLQVDGSDRPIVLTVNPGRAYHEYV